MTNCKNNKQEWKLDFINFKEILYTPLTEEEKEQAIKILKYLFPNNDTKLLLKEIFEIPITSKTNDKFEEELFHLISSSDEEMKKILVLLKYLSNEIYNDVNSKMKNLEDKIAKLEKTLEKLEKNKTTQEEFEKYLKRLERVEHILLYIPASILIGGGIIGALIAVLKYIFTGSTN